MPSGKNLDYGIIGTRRAEEKHRRVEKKRSGEEGRHPDRLSKQYRRVYTVVPRLRTAR